MKKISVVIITKNEAGNIKDCIAAAKQISNDIIVIDSGSTDNTIALAKEERATVYAIEWKGYGHARNTGAALAKHDWIFSLDADERVTDNLVGALSAVSLATGNIVYGLQRINYFGNRRIRYGAFGHDHVARLYNRLHCQWNRAPVHEKLTGSNLQIVLLKANLLHYAAKQRQHYLQKLTHYASLCALKYQQEEKKLIYAGRLLSPPFNFLKEYIFQLGFLDGYAGFTIAKLHAIYTIKKYRQLIELLSEEKQHPLEPTLLTQ